MPLAPATPDATVTTTHGTLLRLRYVALGLVVVALYATSLSHLGTASGSVRCSANAPLTAVTADASATDTTTFVAASDDPASADRGRADCRQPVLEP